MFCISWYREAYWGMLANYHERKLSQLPFLALLWAELCPPTLPQIHMVGFQLRPLQNVTVFGDRAIKEINKVKWSPVGGPWSIMAGVLVRRRGQDTDTHRGTTSQGHGGRTTVCTRRRGAQKKPTLPTPWAWTWSLQIWESKFPLFKPTSLRCFVGTAPAKSYSVSRHVWVWCTCSQCQLWSQQCAEQTEDSSPLPADNAVRGLSMSRRSSMWRDREGRQLWWFLAVDKGGREKSGLLIWRPGSFSRLFGMFLVLKLLASILVLQTGVIIVIS